MRAHDLRPAFDHNRAAAFAALGAKVDDPVGRGDHIEVVLDHDQRMPGLQQLVEGAEQLGDVLEVQAGGGFVEEEEQAGFGRFGQPRHPARRTPPGPDGELICGALRSPHGKCSRLFPSLTPKLIHSTGFAYSLPLRGLGEVAGELEALRLATRQRRHRLAEAQVVEADVGQRRERGEHLGMLAEHVQRLVHRQL
ncbi:MAG: hypothetical protein KA800_13900, partial [Thauera sp.]|nr:hypothetical protein [Thauera sp.]